MLETIPHVTDSTDKKIIRASVIVVNYNGLMYMEPLLSSLRRTLPDDSEVILVDNQSTDGSAEFVAANFPEVKLIRSYKNLGFGGGNNLGVEQASGEYLVFINPDTTAEDGWLSPLLEPLADPQVGMTTSRIMMANDPEIINTCGNAIHFTGLTLCQGLGHPKDQWQHAMNVGAVSGAAFAMRRADFVRLGGFDELIFLYMEDTDLSMRVRFVGMGIRYIPTSIIYHDYQLKINPMKVYYQELHRHLILLKHLRWRTLLIMLPALLLAEMTTWGFVLLREPQRFANKLKAYRWLWLHRATVMDKRQATQALRAVPDRELLKRCVSRLDFGQVGSQMDTRIADWTINPIFGLYYEIMRAVVRW